MLAATATPVQLNPAFVSALVWFFLTILSKAIGQRIPPGKLSETIKDRLVDALTLMFAWQVALSLSQTNLIRGIVTVMRGGATTVVSATGWAIFTNLVIGLAFLALAVVMGLKFAREDELATAWQPLLLFSLGMLIASSMIPWVEEWATLITNNAAIPIAKGVAAGFNYLLSIQISAG
jgi:multisubunit Na+/H+ antiporter MnhC subunit